MKKYTILLSTVAIISLFSCSNKKSINLVDPFKTVQVFVGKWSVNQSDIVENWDLQQPKYYRCISYKNEIDSTYLGESAITEINNYVYLITTIHSKFGAQPKYYKLILNTDSSLVFNNDSISYPRSFEYHITNVNNFSLLVSGQADANDSLTKVSNSFDMERITQ